MGNRAILQSRELNGGLWRALHSCCISYNGVQISVVSLLTVDGKLEEKLVEERRVFSMEEMQVAAIGSFCWNEACEDYQQVNHGNMMKNGKTDKGVQRYLCKTCKKTRVANQG